MIIWDKKWHWNPQSSIESRLSHTKKHIFQCPFQMWPRRKKGEKGPLRAMENNELGSSPRQQNKSPIKTVPTPKATLTMSPHKDFRIAVNQWLLHDFHFPFLNGFIIVTLSLYHHYMLGMSGASIGLLVHKWMDQEEPCDIRCSEFEMWLNKTLGCLL